MVNITRTIVVDLDGTLVHSDMLVENLFLFLRHNPLRIFELVFWLLGGKAHFKRRLADAVLPGVDGIPYNKSLIDWLTQQRSVGARLVLATASDSRIAQRIADHLGIFDEVMGTQQTNLSSHRKRVALVESFGEKGFEYVGNSRADLAVWQSASVIHVANPERGVLAAARRLGETGMVFDARPGYWRTLLKALRVHQWAKNTLIFVPLLASHRIFELPLLWNGLLAFVAFGACASSVYLLNDLLDLPDDRQHATKRNRPLAAGTLPILHALFLIPGLLVAAFAGPLAIALAVRGGVGRLLRAYFGLFAVVETRGDAGCGHAGNALHGARHRGRGGHGACGHILDPGLLHVHLSQPRVRQTLYRVARRAAEGQEGQIGRPWLLPGGL